MKKNALETIVYQEKPVRMQVIDGQPWFVAKDICDILGITNVSQALTSIDIDEKKDITTNDAVGRNQAVRGVDESGMYALIFQSRKPAARGFRKWVTSEVLPSIRRYGRYAAPGSRERLRLEDTMARKERAEWLRSVGSCLTFTDYRVIARRLGCDIRDVTGVLDGRSHDVSVEAECVARAERNAALRELLDDSSFREEIMDRIRREDRR